MTYNQLKNEKNSKSHFNKWLAVFCYFIIIPAILIVNVCFLSQTSYNLVSIAIVFVCMTPFFVGFERKKHTSRELMVIAVMTAISVFGRVIFYVVPGFKPITAIIIITAIYLGSECGFMTGALSAIVSNIFFGQGPWTPFQMFSWGLLGYITGILAKFGIMKFKIAQLLMAVFGGVIFSLVMDIYTVVSTTGTISFKAYGAVVLSSLPWMIVYAFSNVVFILVLNKPIGDKLKRLKEKFEIFE